MEIVKKHFTHFMLPFFDTPDYDSTMHRLVITIFLIITLGAQFCVADHSQDIKQKIDGLADPDPAVRAKCFEELKGMGLAIRPQLEEAARSTDPAISDAAGSLILQLPWYTKDDSPKAKTLLGKYGALSDDEKPQTISSLIESSNPKDTKTVIRVLSAEPNTALVWYMANRVAWKFHPVARDTLISSDFDKLPLALKSTAATQMLFVDYPKGIDLLKKVVELAQVSNGQDVFGFIPVQKLVDESIQSQQWADALKYARLHAAWTDDDMGQARVQFIHAKYGPFQSVGEDFKQIFGKADEYAVAILLNRVGCATPAQILSTKALASSQTNGQVDIGTWNAMVSNFLLSVGQPNLAVLECNQAQGRTDMEIPFLRYTCLLAGNNLAEAADAMDAVAESLTAPIRFTTEDGTDIEMTAVDCRAKAQFLRVQHAIKFSKTDDIDKQLRKLLDMATDFDEITLELIPILDERKLTQQADDIFNRTYTRSLERLKLQSNTPHQIAQGHNNIAWLCARSNRKLNVALERAELAVKLEPCAAYLDTLAEVHFRMGNYEKALEIEKKAYALSPREPSLPEQIKRFEDAINAKKSGNSTSTP